MRSPGDSAGARRELDGACRARGHGDQASWDTLVERFSGLIWSVCRGFGLNRADAADVSQVTWLRLTEHLTRIEQPDRLAAWLVTTTRRECLRHRRLHSRVTPTEIDLEADAEGTNAVDAATMASERDVVLWRRFELLPERSRALLSMLLSDPPVSYGEIAETLDMPIGSIGPTRARLLATLRRHVEAAGIRVEDS
ncbi:MAG: sigma-70 family RNA polymerase sigma factor [Actinobacteria bacterium]|nr:sigma-70 family RNA polymerase sigma factor [Actinomycetota bacterium]